MWSWFGGEWMNEYLTTPQHEKQIGYWVLFGGEGLYIWPISLRYISVFPTWAFPPWKWRPWTLSRWGVGNGGEAMQVGLQHLRPGVQVAARHRATRHWNNHKMQTFQLRQYESTTLNHLTFDSLQPYQVDQYNYSLKAAKLSIVKVVYTLTHF